VIDYIVTIEELQGKGYGSFLVAHVKRLANAFGANLFVLALEDSCPYWMSHGFVLEEGPINRRLNIFPDTHLLKLTSNAADSELGVPDEEEQEQEHVAEQTANNGKAPAADVGDRDAGQDVEQKGGGDDDDGMQRALIQSMMVHPQHAEPQHAEPQHDGAPVDLNGDVADDDELQRAMAASLAAVDAAAAPSTQSIPAMASDEEEDDEEMMLARAMSLSMEKSLQ
jgi:hypothetical protein